MTPSNRGDIALDKAWAEAARRCRLTPADVRMAKELGFKPRSLLKNQPFWVPGLAARDARRRTTPGSDCPMHRNKSLRRYGVGHCDLYRVGLASFERRPC